MMNQYSYLKRAMRDDRSNQKSKHSETIDYQRSRSRSNRQAAKANAAALSSSQEKSAVESNQGQQEEGSSELSDAEVTMSNLNEADQMVIGAKQVIDP